MHDLLHEKWKMIVAASAFLAIFVSAIFTDASGGGLVLILFAGTIGLVATIADLVHSKPLVLTITDVSRIAQNEHGEWTVEIERSEHRKGSAPLVVDATVRAADGVERPAHSRREGSGLVVNWLVPSPDDFTQLQLTVR